MKPAPALEAFLIDQGLAQTRSDMVWTALPGGVSSEIWRVDLPQRSVCVKRALPKLKVKADWYAPTARNAFECQWLQFAHQQVPQAVPQVLAHDRDAGLFVMDFLPPEQYPVWKEQLLRGEVDLDTAAQVGRLVATIHNASASQPSIAQAFDTRDFFFALRLEPYLLATAQKHHDLATALQTLTERTAAAHIALVHGDVSPKNILVGPHSPVLLDAECAWYGDPAFDLAFCLNHLLLKCLVHPDKTAQYLQAFDNLASNYLNAVQWEPKHSLEERAAALLPALLLARVDGKSPVEYLVRDQQRNLVRSFARPRISAAPTKLADIAQDWRRACAVLKLA